MDCKEIRPLLEADLDGELDLVRHLEIEAHLRTCPDCARFAEAARARQATLRSGLSRYAAPASLQKKIRASLQPEAASTNSFAPKASRPFFAQSFWRIGGLAASLAFAGLFGYVWGHAQAHANQLIDEAISDHVRSLQAGHLMDVASTDQHTVKPWFAGKLDFSPPVVDLAAAGFPLEGGRLEHLDNRPAAALIFHRRQHAINLFIWPAGTTSLARHHAERNGYNTEAWSDAGLNFLAVSEIPDAELIQFAETFRSSTR
jgi:anti-sigma factor RsiW